MISKIGFTQLGNSQSTNGFTYLCMLLNAVEMQYGNSIKKNLVYWDEEYINALNEYKVKIDFTTSINISYPKRFSLDWFKKSIFRKMYGRDMFYNKEINLLLEEMNIDVLFGVNNLHLDRIRWVSWIQDFQHTHLPGFFSDKEICSRETEYKKRAKYANKVILSSEAVKKDFIKLYPEYKFKASVMQFVANVPSDVYIDDPGFICKEYRLPKKFFYVPNQFWKHKNHLLLLKSIKIAKEKSQDIFVVLTGPTNDYRNPRHFDDILVNISNLGLRNNVAILGLVPRKHFYYLARQSVSIINPSLFEGWSTSVEEAKSIGKPIILSDIDVHREQAPLESKYFRRKDENNLAEALCEYWIKYKPGPNLMMEELSRNLLTRRIRKFGENFISIVGKEKN